MFYLSGNKRGNLLGVVDTDDMVEEFYSPEFLSSIGVEIIRFNKELEIGYTFKTKCFKFTLIEENNIRGWKLEALEGIDTFRNKASYLGYPVISLEECFCNYKTKGISQFRNIDTTEHKFENCTSLNLRNMDTSNVITMKCMFENYTSLTTLDLSNFDTSNVTDMNGMFYGCSSLTTLDVGNFDTSKVTNIGGMFKNCTSLITLDLSNFDTSKVIDMGCVFENCTSLTTLDLSNFDTSKVIDMGYMFENCTSLTTLDLSNFVAGEIAYIGSMFENCTSLTTLDLSNFKIGWVDGKDSMFYDCDNLVVVHTSSKEIAYECNARIKLVPWSSGIAYDKLIKDKKEIAKYLLLDFKGVIAYKK